MVDTSEKESNILRLPYTKINTLFLPTSVQVRSEDTTTLRPTHAEHDTCGKCAEQTVTAVPAKPLALCNPERRARFAGRAFTADRYFLGWWRGENPFENVQHIHCSISAGWYNVYVGAWVGRRGGGEAQEIYAFSEPRALRARLGFKKNALCGLTRSSFA